MMRALRWHGAQELRVEQIPIPQPGPQDVRIAVQYCGICGSDLHEYESGPHAIPVGTPHAVSGRTAPLTLGHEFCGTVVEVGSEVSHLQVGDRVAVEPEYRCSHCAYCRSGAYNLCADMGFAGLMGDGGMAEFAVVPSYMLHRLPSGVSLEQAAVMEPAAVALHALRRSQLPAGGSCAIFGLGPIGLLLIKLAKLQGAGTIIAVDVSPERLHMARQAGASLVIDGKGLSAHELRHTIASATGGLGVDTSFEAAGLQATFEGAIRALRKGGNMVMVGLMSEARFDAFEAVNRELSLVASVGYRDVYQALIGLIEAGDFDPTSIITKTVPLERAVSEGFAALVQDRSQIKILVSPAMAHHNTLQDKPMTHSMEDKVILITGGTSGIGANTALHFAHAGASVLAIGLDAEGLHAPRHPRIQCLELDVCDSAKLSQTIGELPRLDALVNAAGISRHAEEYQPEAFLQVLHTNLTAVMQASMAAAPLLLKSGGCIVNVASMFSYFGSKDRPAYSASKGGIVQLTRSLAQTWAHEGVRVNAVAPGWIATPLSEGLMANPQASAKILSRTPLQRWGHAAEVAEVIGFLCSPAASFVNGAVIPLDGGYLTA